MPSSVSSLRVRYAETDKMGVVYYANYLVWFEVGRADLLRSLGWSYREMEAAGISLPVIDARCQYLRPARNAVVPWTGISAQGPAPAFEIRATTRVEP